MANAYQSVGPVNFESVSNVTATPSVMLGTVREQGNDKYVYAYNAGNSQASVGKVVVASAVSGFSVTVSSISGDFAAGVVKHATLTTGTYGWLLTRGFVDGMLNAMASTAIVAGNPIQVAVDGGVCKGEVGPYIGKAMTATGSAGTAAAFIAIY